MFGFSEGPCYCVVHCHGKFCFGWTSFTPTSVLVLVIIHGRSHSLLLPGSSGVVNSLLGLAICSGSFLIKGKFTQPDMGEQTTSHFFSKPYHVFFFVFFKFFSAFFFLIFKFIYLWLCWVFVSVRGLSLVVASGGHSSSQCTGLSLSRPLLLRSTGSRRAGSAAVAHGPSCSTACGIFPDQGSNLCPLHWQADSQPLHHQGSPTMPFYFSSRVHRQIREMLFKGTNLQLVDK